MLTTALIGCGRIGFLLESDPLRNKPCTHWGGARAAGIRITHACDSNPERLRAFGAMSGLAAGALYEDYRRLLLQERPALVIIATWTESHARIAIEAARSGARAIVLEKPMAHDLTAARRIIDTCRQTGTALLVNHERRYDGRYRTLKRIVTEGRLGVVQSLHGRVLTGPYRGPDDPGEGGGPLLHDGTHLIDMIRYLCGDIRVVTGECRRDSRPRGYEDRALAWLKVGNDIDCFIEAGGSRRYFQFELELSGSEGAAVIGNGYEALYRSRSSRLYTGFRDLAPVPFPKPSAGNCFTRLYREAAAAARGRVTAVTSSGHDGYAALEAVHAVYYSWSRGGKPVTLPLAPERVHIRKIFSLSGK